MLLFLVSFYLARAASAASRCCDDRFFGPPLLDPAAPWLFWVAAARAAVAWAAASASPSFWPFPASLNFASVFFFSKVIKGYSFKKFELTYLLVVA